VKTASFGIVWL